MGLSPGAGAGLAERASRHNHGASGPHNVGGKESAFASTPTIWQVDHSRKRFAGGSLFRLRTFGQSSSGDMDPSGEFWKPRPSREWQTQHWHDRFPARRDKDAGLTKPGEGALR